MVSHCSICKQDCVSWVHYGATLFIIPSGPGAFVGGVKVIAWSTSLSVMSGNGIWSWYLAPRISWRSGSGKVYHNWTAMLKHMDSKIAKHEIHHFPNMVPTRDAINHGDISWMSFLLGDNKLSKSRLGDADPCPSMRLSNRKHMGILESTSPSLEVHHISVFNVMKDGSLVWLWPAGEGNRCWKKYRGAEFLQELCPLL